MKTTIESSGRMHNPAHPGEILKEMYMGPLGVTITQTADALGVSRKHVSAIVNGRVPVSPASQAGALRQAIDPDSLPLPLHLSLLTYAEAMEVDAVRIQHASRIYP